MFFSNASHSIPLIDQCMLLSIKLIHGKYVQWCNMDLKCSSTKGIETQLLYINMYIIHITHHTCNLSYM